MDYKSLYEALLADTKRLAFSRIVASHLALVALYDLKGIDALYPDVKTKCNALINRMAALGKPVKLSEGFRTAARQHALYTQGRTTPGSVVTNADALESFHQFCVAFDLVFTEHGYNPPSAWWEVLGSEGEKLGLRWGGRWSNFPDRPHFEWDSNGMINLKELADYLRVQNEHP